MIKRLSERLNVGSTFSAFISAYAEERFQENQFKNSLKTLQCAFARRNMTGIN